MQLFFDLMERCAFHCCSVGYPVVTMGFSIKSCISYRFRLVSTALLCSWYCLLCIIVLLQELFCLRFLSYKN